MRTIRLLSLFVFLFAVSTTNRAYAASQWLELTGKVYSIEYFPVGNGHLVMFGVLSSNGTSKLFTLCGTSRGADSQCSEARYSEAELLVMYQALQQAQLAKTSVKVGYELADGNAKAYRFTLFWP
jgi:hypothetical protein